jgi:hypothetical protein
MTHHEWSRGDKIAGVAVLVALVSVVATIAIPEIRRFVGLDTISQATGIARATGAAEPPGTARAVVGPPPNEHVPAPRFRATKTARSWHGSREVGFPQASFGDDGEMAAMRDLLGPADRREWSCEPDAHEVVVRLVANSYEPDGLTIRGFIGEQESGLREEYTLLDTRLRGIGNAVASWVPLFLRKNRWFSVVFARCTNGGNPFVDSIIGH